MRLDNFTAKTVEILFKRAGGKCCICRATTFGPNDKSWSSTSIGQAAHISAAAPGGPRYDEKMPSEERKSARNGMWLCSNCHDKVDRNVETYTLEKLREIKHKGESEAKEELGRPPSKSDQGDQLPVMLDALAIHQIRQMKGKIISTDKEGINKKAEALVEELSGLQLGEDSYSVAVSREMLRFLSKLTQLAGVDINLGIAYEVASVTTESIDTHGTELTTDDIQLAVDISSMLARASLKSKREPTETQVLYERAISLASHTIKVMKRVGGAQDERTRLAVSMLKTIRTNKPSSGSRTRLRPRDVTDVNGGDESDGKITELFADFDRYTELVTKLADTEAPDAQFELESKILSLGFSYY